MTIPFGLRLPGGMRSVREGTLVELLVWTYQRQKADVMSERGLWGPEAEVEAAEEGHPKRRWSGCGCAQIEAIARLGARIDGGGWQRPALHVDAETVHEAVIALGQADWAGAQLLCRWARTGTAPDWDVHQEFEPVRDSRDRIVQNHFDEICKVRDSRGRLVSTPLRYCPIEKYPSDAWIVMVRAEYRAWHQALVRLGKKLAGAQLVSWRLTGLGASSAPWQEQHDLRD